jgi:hypothetical protein
MGVEVVTSGPQVCVSSVRDAPAPAPMLNEYSASTLKSHEPPSPAVETFVTSSAMSTKTWATMPAPTDRAEFPNRAGALSSPGKPSWMPVVAVRRKTAVITIPALSMVTGRNSKRPPGLWNSQLSVKLDSNLGRIDREAYNVMSVASAAKIGMLIWIPSANLI